MVTCYARLHSGPSHCGPVKSAASFCDERFLRSRSLRLCLVCGEEPEPAVCFLSGRTAKISVVEALSLSVLPSLERERRGSFRSRPLEEAERWRVVVPMSLCLRGLICGELSPVRGRVRVV